MALGGTPEEHCVRANEYADDLLSDIRTFRGMVNRAGSPRIASDHAKTGIYNVDSRLSALRAEMRWVMNDCPRKTKIASAVRSAHAFKGDMFEARGASLGFLPEFGNVWPAYLAIGSLALWLWNAKKA
jgi:hypothetical protein